MSDKMIYRIVETDNYGGDYPNERFVSLPVMNKVHAEAIAHTINDCLCTGGFGNRYWKVVEKDYKLVGGFEP